MSLSPLASQMMGDGAVVHGVELRQAVGLELGGHQQGVRPGGRMLRPLQRPLRPDLEPPQGGGVNG